MAFLLLMPSRIELRGRRRAFDRIPFESEAAMFEVNSLNEQEITLLRQMVETALGETRVELHHTHFTPEFRDRVKQEEAMLRGILDKLQRQPV
jgi:hypothetical protein